MVYFVQGRVTGLIKIGTSTRNWKQRFQQMALSEVVVCLRVIEGGYAIENQWHQRYKSARSHGEWFKPVPQLLTAIEQLPRSADTGTEYVCGTPVGPKAPRTGGRWPKRFPCRTCGRRNAARTTGKNCDACALVAIREQAAARRNAITS